MIGSTQSEVMQVVDNFDEYAKKLDPNNIGAEALENLSHFRCFEEGRNFLFDRLYGLDLNRVRHRAGFPMLLNNLFSPSRGERG